jgi:hypothetical protein
MVEFLTIRPSLLLPKLLLVAGFSDRSNWAMRRRNGGLPRRAVAASGQTGQDKLAELREVDFVGVRVDS